jgi:hypothetical protein
MITPLMPAKSTMKGINKKAKGVTAISKTKTNTRFLKGNMASNVRAECTSI